MRAATLINIDLITLFFLTQLFSLYCTLSLSLNTSENLKGALGINGLRNLKKIPEKLVLKATKKT